MRQHSLDIRGIRFPIAFNGSGARGFFGDGKEYWYHRFFRLIGLTWRGSTFVAKTTTLCANKGNMRLKADGYTPADLTPDCIYLRQAWRGRVLNAVGLSGPGFQALLKTGKWKTRTEPFLISFMAIGKSHGERMSEYAIFIEQLIEARKAGAFGARTGLQINISCPNAGHALKVLMTETCKVLDMFAAEKELDDMPLFIKTNILFPTELAARLDKHARLDGWFNSNTVHWDLLPELGIDRRRIFGSDTSPLAMYGGGGYSGPEMRRHVKTWIRLARSKGVTKPIIAENGIRFPWHAVEMIDAGADGIAVASMAICGPFLTLLTFLAAHWAVGRKQVRETVRSAERIVIHRPDDWHVHLRFGAMMRLVMEHTAKVFGRYLVMPNRPAIRTLKEMSGYRRAIELWARLIGLRASTPIMTIMIDPQTTKVDILQASEAGALAGKVYPANVTTGSEGGASNIYALWPLFRQMWICRTRPLPGMRPVRMALCLHGEMPGVYCIEREIAFLKVVYAVLRDFPGMPVTLEHITTKESVQFVRAMSAQGHRIAASITPHHLLRTLDDVVGSKVNVHEHCQPVPKGPRDREALIEAATSGDACFFLGTDSAPHAKDDKECAEGCAGVFNAPCALETVAEVFEARGTLDHRFDRFVSLNGARHYSLPPNMDKIVLVRRPWRVPKRIGNVIPWRAGETIAWQVESR